MGEKLETLADMFSPEELNHELMAYINTSSTFLMIHHPLIIQVPYHESMNKLTNSLFAHKKELLEKAIETENWSSFVFLHERPYRMSALQEVLSAFSFHPSDEEVCKMVASVWADSENIRQNLVAWKQIWKYVSKIKDRFEFLMDETEIEKLNSLPEQFTIYRGTSYKTSVKGMSWTVDRDKAVWFAKRMRGKRRALLASTTIEKKDVLAFFHSRNENEIVIEKVKTVKMCEIC